MITDINLFAEIFGMLLHSFAGVHLQMQISKET